MFKVGIRAIFAGSLTLCATSLMSQLPIKSRTGVRAGMAAPGRAMASRYPFGKPQTILGERLFSGVGALADVDIDGFPDLVFGGTFFLETGGTFSYITLDEHRQKKSESRLASPSKNPTHVFPHIVSADLNEDHLPDLIGIGRHGGIAIHLRAMVENASETGKLTLGWRSRHYIPKGLDSAQIGALFFGARVVQVMDLDEDGHVDLLVAGDFLGIEGIIKTSGLLFLRGDGLGGFGRPKTLLADRVLALQTADLNDDGELDLVVLGKGGTVSLMIKKRTGGYIVHKVKLTAIGDAATLKVRDIDQDGIEDFILLGGCSTSQCFEAAIYRGLKDGMPGPGTILRGALPRKEAITSYLVEDLDSDGFPDLALLCIDPLGRTHLELFAGDKKQPWATRETLPLNILLAVELSNQGTGYLKYEDIDGDGNRDLWVSPVRSKPNGVTGILYLRNQGVHRGPIQRLGTATASGSRAIPRISTAGGQPRIGNDKFAFRLSHVPGNRSPYWLWISHVRMDVQILGMRVKVFPFRSVMVRSVGAGETAGIVRIPFRIPLDRALVGEDFFFQWVFPSKGAKNPLSLARSEALQVTFLSDSQRSLPPRLR